MTTKTAADWYAEYGAYHQNPTNKLIHWLYIPAIMTALVGLLWSLRLRRFARPAGSGYSPGRYSRSRLARISASSIQTGLSSIRANRGDWSA